MRKPYKAKTMSGAQARVRSLEKQLERANALFDRHSRNLELIERERKLMARLAAKPPQFSSPIELYNAERVRDLILGDEL